MSTLPEYAELKAKFQVYDGVGPTDMIAVVSPAADENAFTESCRKRAFCNA